MPEFLDRRDLDFQLYEVHGLETLATYARYAAHDRAVFDGILDTAVSLAEERFWPHAAKADAEEPHFDGERVHMIPEVAAALAAYREAGFFAAGFDEVHGGLQLPQLLNSALGMIFTAANVGTAAYPFLTQAAANLLAVHGTPEQKSRWMQPMVEGRYFGTMCLSEPQAGSSLADIRTRAIPQPEGGYHLVGNKMWISGGEHELSENIVHLVLARIEGAPAGTKGISLFIVPRRHLRGDGTPGEKNGVRLIGLNHKMGYRGTVNTVLSFGDDVPCVAELVGEPHQGLRCMFHMMNEARIGVGLGACALGVAGYRVSLAYARERPQGRPLTSKDPSVPQVPIIEHADVRRMLLAQKAWVEGGLSLCLYCARLVDEQRCTDDADARQAIDALLGLLTPIAKAWPAEWCLEANKLAIQVLGGYGYTRDYPVERFYRDNRLNPIHEGTNGIQAIDLLGRKVFGDGGRTLAALAERIGRCCDAAASMDGLADYAGLLRQALQRLAETSATLGQRAAQGGPDAALVNASTYLDMVGHTVIAWQWLEQARVASAALSGAAASDAAFYRGKLAACHHFFIHELPRTRVAAEVLAGDDRALLTLNTGDL